MEIRFLERLLESKDYTYQKPYCGGLNDNGLHRLTCLNTWPSIDVIIWEELEAMV